MLVTGIVLVVIVVAWVLLNLKTSRPDGWLIDGVHKYRQMMWYIMPTRNESVVYYDTYVRSDRLIEYLERVEQRGAFHADMTHAAVAAVLLGLVEAPKMNRFVVGRRFYQRTGRQITFSVKRKKGAEDAKLSAIKMELHDGESFQDLCKRVVTEIDVQRSDQRTSHDKEYDFLTAIPRPLLRFGCGLFRWLDYYNILPGAFIDGDPMYTSCFIANLGSVQMQAGYHHLYEWGTCPLFLMIGRIEQRALVNDDGEVEVANVLPLRWTYDERVDDGMSARRGILAANAVLEDPFTYLGCVADDDGDVFPLGDRQIAPERLKAS